MKTDADKIAVLVVLGALGTVALVAAIWVWLGSAAALATALVIGLACETYYDRRP